MADEHRKQPTAEDVLPAPGDPSDEKHTVSMDESATLWPSWGTLVVYFGGFLAVVFLLAPMLVLISISFSGQQFAQFPPRGFSLEWYVRMWEMPGFVDSLWLSLRLAIVVTIINVVLGTASSVGLALGNIRGKQVIMTFLLSPLIVPSIVLGIALLQFFTLVGSNAPFLHLTLGHVVLTLPYIVRTASASLDVLDRQMIDSARVLGAGPFQVFWKVILPLIWPGVAAGAVFVLLVSFDNFTISMFLQDARNVPLPIRIFGYMEVVLDPTIMAISSFLIFGSLAVLLLAHQLLGLNRLRGGGLG